MYLLYIDESGVSNIPGNTSHFVLTGISVPIWHWKDCDVEILNIKRRYDLFDAEIHTAWIMRRYLEQAKIPDFESLQFHERRSVVTAERIRELFRLQKTNNSKLYKQTKKNYEKTKNYIHLTHEQRKSFIDEVAKCVSNWGFARVFAECVDKTHFDPVRSPTTLDEQALEQIVSRFEQYLANISVDNSRNKSYGLLIHDNNDTVSQKHTQLMKSFHDKGLWTTTWGRTTRSVSWMHLSTALTLRRLDSSAYGPTTTSWTDLKHIVETPLFVDSSLTSLVQIADLCAYSIRRYLENNEEGLFDHIYKRADRNQDTVVGIRHFSDPSCLCKICDGHKR